MKNKRRSKKDDVASKLKPIDRMFESERDFSNLKLGCKATIFEKDKNIVLNTRKGNYTLIKYINFT